VGVNQVTLWSPGLLLVLAVQVVLVVALIVSGVRRGRLIRERDRLNEAASVRTAEIEMQRREMAHLGRVAALGELSGALAHELRQPLSAILSNVKAAQRILASQHGNTEVGEILADISSDVRRASDVIQNASSLMKKEPARNVPVQLNEVVRKSLDLMHGELTTRRVVVTVLLSPSLPMVVGDCEQLQQVMLNLVMNACDAVMTMRPDDRRLVVSTTVNDGEVRLSVADNGCGVADGNMERLFEPFYTSKEHGLGLGLSICRSIVASHSGRLWAVSNPNRGTTFHMTTPIAGVPAVHVGSLALRPLETAAVS
jgi:C4-dicarboxylate-specific signal transduction histidine kinase